jgi:hypothetical protein
MPLRKQSAEKRRLLVRQRLYPLDEYNYYWAWYTKIESTSTLFDFDNFISVVHAALLDSDTVK